MRNSKVKSKKYRFYCDENEYTENGCKCNYQCHINRKYDPTNDLFIVYNGATIDNSDLKQTIPTKSQCVKLYSEILKQPFVGKYGDQIQNSKPVCLGFGKTITPGNQKHASSSKSNDTDLDIFRKYKSKGGSSAYILKYTKHNIKQWSGEETSNATKSKKPCGGKPTVASKSPNLNMGNLPLSNRFTPLYSNISETINHQVADYNSEKNSDNSSVNKSKIKGGVNVDSGILSSNNLLSKSVNKRLRPKNRTSNNKDYLKKKNYTDKNITLALWNAQSVRNKTSEIKRFRKENDIDIYLIVESWLNESQHKTIASLKSAENDLKMVPRVGRTGGGICCIHKKQINIKQVETPPTKTFEIMELLLTVGSLQVTLVTIYRPQSSNKNKYSMEEFHNEFTDILVRYHLIKHEVIILGDFNFHVNKHDDKDAKEFIEILENFNLIQHIVGPTHREGNTLDLLITRKKSLVNHYEIVDSISDHSNILVNIDLNKPKKLKKIIKYRKIGTIDTNSFKRDITNKISVNNPTDNIGLIKKYNSLSEVLDNHAPLIEKEITIRDPTPWKTEDIKEEKQKKRKLERRWRKTKTQIDRDLYTAQRNKYNQLLESFEINELSKKIDDCNGDIKKLFRVVDNALNRKQETPYPECTSDETLANKFSNFFNEKIETIRNKLDEHSVSFTEEVTFKGTPLKEFKELSLDDTRKLIIKTKNSYNDLLDPLPTILVKECLEELLPLITEIINKSLSLGIVEDPLKEAIIKPLLKKMGLELLEKNYRPVSNLSFISKLIESAVADQYINHLNLNKLRDPKQSAYKKFHSTETLLLKVKDNIQLHIDNGEVVLVVLLDLSAAFDTIDHNILLNRLEKRYGIQGDALKWFTSYLSDRSQAVNINSAISDKVPLKHGVPQGSILGPILFNSYIAPLSNIAKMHGIEDEKFADDEQMALAFRTSHLHTQINAVIKMENCIEDIRKFLIKNKLSNNGDKTECSLFGTTQQLSKIKFDSIDVDGIHIRIKDKVKNLGVMFDKTLSMETHVNKICSVGYLNLKNINEIRKSLNKDNTKILVNALVTSHLDYGNSLLYGISNKLMNKLQVLQNASVRIIEKLKKHDRVSQYRKQLHWLPIQARIEFKIIKFTWQCLNNMAPTYLVNKLNIKANTRYLRSENNSLLTVPRTNLATYGDICFSKVAPKLWNDLPTELKSIKSLDLFKKRLKTFLFKKFYE